MPVCEVWEASVWGACVFIVRYQLECACKCVWMCVYVCMCVFYMNSYMLQIVCTS